MKPISQQKIALKRIEELFHQANEQDDRVLCKRYVVLARKISQKYKVRLTKEQKLLFCRKCNAYLRQGKNSKIRLTKGLRSLKCLECGYVRRMRYK
jgi:ribonuclease P protein subunit RPR2